MTKRTAELLNWIVKHSQQDGISKTERKNFILEQAVFNEAYNLMEQIERDEINGYSEYPKGYSQKQRASIGIS
ncbi:hypothetical protein UFOVP1116_14 [uncultured Caudovirales phage]|uniref:Uncharacterized protein n=1 Tax=uncultured Caudovirales phage TaxID=2100421 RepID=A0A6J5S6J7_9CAUD|nr:hypothetical protein UFOVP1116_14 [uncultured Caudovirales phage]CAB4204116.1 hypothetical protein UFOVP1391_34 [uncultured Caudovirales phage]CAB4215547.1 hypothetical protein UFOVP1480_25 [uncultured Caudovirales phage]CAB5229972.1 hypothetical protein UFOVP1568_27 [uncultured Caudovirales phage]